MNWAQMFTVHWHVHYFTRDIIKHYIRTLTIPMIRPKTGHITKLVYKTTSGHWQRLSASISTSPATSGAANRSDSKIPSWLKTICYLFTTDCLPVVRAGAPTQIRTVRSENNNLRRWLHLGGDHYSVSFISEIAILAAAVPALFDWVIIEHVSITADGGRTILQRARTWGRNLFGGSDLHRTVGRETMGRRRRFAF